MWKEKIQERRENCNSEAIFNLSGMRMCDFTVILFTGNWLVQVPKKEISSYSMAMGTKYIEKM